MFRISSFDSQFAVPNSDRPVIISKWSGVGILKEEVLLLEGGIHDDSILTSCFFIKRSIHIGCDHRVSFLPPIDGHHKDYVLNIIKVGMEVNLIEFIVLVEKFCSYHFPHCWSVDSFYDKFLLLGFHVEDFRSTKQCNRFLCWIPLKFQHFILIELFFHGFRLSKYFFNLIFSLDPLLICFDHLLFKINVYLIWLFLLLFIVFLLFLVLWI